MLNFTKIRPVGVTRYKQSCRDWFANLPSKDFQTYVLHNITLKTTIVQLEQ